MPPVYVMEASQWGKGLGMLDWFRALMPKEDKFFVLFDRHAETVAAGAAALSAMLAGHGSIADGCRTISEREEAADVVTRDVLLAVRRTFITPFDRGDIQSLTTALDDSIDQMQKTAKAIHLFEVRGFEPPMAEMGRLIEESADVVREAVPLLRSIGQNATRLNALTEKIIALEGRADDIHNQGLKALYMRARDQNDPMSYIVGTEIYDHLERVMDRFEDVANQISSILVEHL